MALVSSPNGTTSFINPGQPSLRSKGKIPLFSLNSLNFRKSPSNTKHRLPTSVIKAVAANPDIDFSDPNWIQQYQDEFGKRFNLPHLRDVFDMKPFPTTFSIKNR